MTPPPEERRDQVAAAPRSADGDPPTRRTRAGHRRPARASRHVRRELPLWQESILLLVLALGLAVLIKSFLVQAFYIPSGSMHPTLLEDDRILVEKLSYRFGEVDRGDVVVFDDPGGWLATAAVVHADNPATRMLEFIGLFPTGGHLVKRVVGVGGDHVECCDARGRVSVNGVPLREQPYLPSGVAPSSQEFSVHVPPDSLWVMGDNRVASADSRSHQTTPDHGFIPMEDVVGRLFVIVWPPNRVGGVGTPDTYDAARLQR